METNRIKPGGKGFLPVILPALTGGAAFSYVYFCEKLQFYPFTSKTTLLSLAAMFFAASLTFSLLFFFLRKSCSCSGKREWLPLLLSSLILSVCILLWLPVPDTGLFPAHTLEIRALPDESGTVRPVTLTWIHRENGDISLSSVSCEGNCRFGEFGPTLEDENGRITWSGKTGDLITIEFVSDTDQGIAEIRWDNDVLIAPLNNELMDRISYDHVFPNSEGMAEAAAVWVIAFLLSLAGTFAAVKLFPAWRFQTFAAGTSVCFIIFRIQQFRTAAEPLIFIDSESYLGMSQMPVKDIIRGVQYCHSQFWYCIARPALIPLLYKLCRQDIQTITVLQLVVSLLCWIWFAHRASGLCKNDITKKTAFILSLGLGCIPNVTRWDPIIMSESFSISAAMLLMGSLFWLTQPDGSNRWRPLPALFTAISALLYVQTRDSASWSVILIIILLLCVNRIRSEKKVIFILCIVLAAVCWSVMGNTGGRWQYPFENVLFNRILRDPQGESFFTEAGMPVPQRIGELHGVEHMMGSELFNSEEMAPLREWILTDGLKTYIRYMLRDPLKTLGMAWPEFEKEVTERIDCPYNPEGFYSLLPVPVAKFFSGNLPALMIIGIGLIGLFAAFRCRDGIRLAFPLLFIFSAYVLCSGVLIADEYEFTRHSIVIILMLKASLWPLLCCLGEKLIIKTGAVHLENRNAGDITLKIPAEDQPEH